MKQKIRLLILMTLAAAVLAGCACNGATATPTPQPSAMTATPMPSPMESASPSPEGTAGNENMPSASPESSGAPGMMGVDTERLITELEKLSEVDTAEVVAEGNRAIVGLNFDAQYQGTLTERIEEMAVEAIARVESALTDVAVTADPTLVTEIRTLAQETKGQTLTEEQKTKFDELYRKIKPGSTQGSVSLSLAAGKFVNLLRRAGERLTAGGLRSIMRTSPVLRGGIFKIC